MEIVCLKCGGPREIEKQPEPGVTIYRRCGACGEIGIRRVNDSYRHFNVKKPVREPYERSRYRGGKLMGP